MGTQNYNFTYLEPDSDINLVGDTTTFLDEIDSTIHNVGLAPVCPTVHPVYMGDFISDIQAACCAKVGTRFYTVSANNYDGYGNVRVFDTTLNSQIYFKDNIKVGHANSIAYDEVLDKFWLTPMFTYNQGEKTNLNAIYLYNSNFTSYTEINTPSRVYGVSYDSVTQTLYYFNHDDGVLTLYRYDRNTQTFSTFKNIDWSIIARNNTITLQDFAVNNSVIYISTITGFVMVGNITDADTVILDRSFAVHPHDSQNLWYTGELEGMEFDQNGYLYCVKNAYFGYTGKGVTGENKCDAFICNIPLKNSFEDQDYYAFKIHPTLYIRDDTVSAFKLAIADIRSLHQLNFLNDRFATVEIHAHNLEEYDVEIINRDVLIRFMGDSSYKVNRIYCMSSKINLKVNGTSRLEFTDTDHCINQAHRTCEITLVVDTNAFVIIQPNARFIQSSTDRYRFNFGSGGNLTSVRLENSQIEPYHSTVGSQVFAFA